MLISELMGDAHKSLSELAEKLRAALHNENLADVVQTAANQCKAASEHQDASYDVADVHAAVEKGEKIAPSHEANPELSGKPAERSASEMGSG